MFFIFGKLGILPGGWVFIPMKTCTSTHRDAHRLLYDRKEAARQLSISVRSLDYIIAARGLDTRRIGKKVLVTHASLVRYAQANHFDAIAPPARKDVAMVKQDAEAAA